VVPVLLRLHHSSSEQKADREDEQEGVEQVKGCTLKQLRGNDRGNKQQKILTTNEHEIKRLLPVRSVICGPKQCRIILTGHVAEIAAT
jgi:hypothetical protein